MAVGRRWLRREGRGACGWTMHLAADAVTARGVPAFWPLPIRVRLPPGLRTNSRREALVVLAWIAACASWAVYPYLGVVPRL